MTLPFNSLPYKYLFRFISILIISGFAAQYFFLAAFTLMCAMSCEVWLQLRYGKNLFNKVIQMISFSFLCVFRGNAANEKRYRTEIWVGYVLPLIFSIITGLVEAFGSRCSSVTPKFAEENCFFSCMYIL